MVAPEPAEAPVIPVEILPIVQVNVLGILDVRLILVLVPLQIVFVAELVTAGLGLTNTTIE